MATLSPTPTPGLIAFAGIKMPNLINRFRVSFIDSNTKAKLPESDGLASQLVSFGSTSLKRGARSSDVSPVVAVFEDDVTNVACRGLQNLILRPYEQMFDIIVEQLDGADGVLRTMSYVDTRAETIDFPEMQYNAGFGPNIQIQLRTPKLNGRDLKQLEETNPLLYSVYDLVNNTSIEVRSPEAFAAPNGASQFKVTFMYSRLETRYSN